MRKKLVILAVVPLMTLAACSESPKSNAQSTGQKLTEQAFAQQQKTVPYPAAELTYSLERENLRKRLLIETNPDKIGYVYVMNFGRFIGYYTVKGKISSTQSQMTTSQLVVESDFGEGWESQVVDAPGDNGSYGENERGIFFFTTSDAYVSTNMDYVYLDQPMQIDVPELIK